MKLRTVCFTILSSFVFMATAANAASITGKINYEGKVPKFRQIKMDADPICLTKHANPVFPQKLVLGEGNTIEHVFVHITSGLPNKKYAAPTETATINQAGCMYTPHVMGVMVGQPIDFLNPDGTLHNVHAVAKVNKEFNIAMPKFRKKITRSFDKPEIMVKMKCDVHPWMGAYIAVMEHPFFNVTGNDGVYNIENLPAGTYEVEAWHEKLGVQKSSITLADGDTKEINFTFKKPEKK